MREFMRIVEGVEEIGGMRVSLNPSPSQLPSLCHNLSKHRALRGWFFITKTDPRIQCVVWAAEKQSHFAMGNAMRRAGFDAVQSSPLIISLDVNDTLQACDWGSWNVYQSGDLFYVRDRFGQTADFDETFNHFFPSSEELEVEYNDDSEWEIVEGIVENASRDSHYIPLEPLFKDRRGGSMRKYRITKTGETLLVAVMRDGTDGDGDDIYSVTPYISKDGFLKDIGNGKVVVSNGTAYFSNIGIIPEYRRLGIATAMYDQIEDMGFDLGMSPGDVFPDALNMWSYRSGRSGNLTESQEEINGTVYLKSPSLGVLKAYVQRDWAKNLRGLLAPNLKDVYVWKGEQKLHDEAMKDLGLDYRSVGLSYWNFRFDIQFNDTDNAYYFRVGADNHYAFADNRYIRSITDIDEETPGVAIRLK